MDWPSSIDECALTAVNLPSEVADFLQQYVKDAYSTRRFARQLDDLNVRLGLRLPDVYCARHHPLQKVSRYLFACLLKHHDLAEAAYVSHLHRHDVAGDDDDGASACRLPVDNFGKLLRAVHTFKLAMIKKQQSDKKLVIF